MEEKRKTQVFGQKSLRALVGEGTTPLDPELERSNLENEVFGGLPGDDRSGHPKQYTFNPWINKPPTETLRLLQEGNLSETDKAQILEAIQYLGSVGELGATGPEGSG